MRTVDVAVVGAGPAGIAAALAAAEVGAETVLIDENPKIGGQLRWRVSLTLENTAGFELPAGPGPKVADSLAATLETTPNLTVETDTVAWGLFEDNVLGISTESAADELQATSVVLATGSTDITYPFPGWTLPGVMTARAAQVFMHVHRVLPGRTWVVLGDGTEADELVVDLERAGVEVITRCTDVEQIRASGTNRLSHVEVDADVYEADSLAIALGRQPDAELALQAKADAEFVRALGGYTVRRNGSGETSESSVYVAGDAGGIASLPELTAEGRLVGLIAAHGEEAAVDQARTALKQVSSIQRSEAIEQLRLLPLNS